LIQYPFDTIAHLFNTVNLPIDSKITFLLRRRRWPTRLQHFLQHPILDPRHRLVLYGREVEHSAEMRDMAGERVSSEVGAILPFADVGVTCTRVALVSVFHLCVIRVPLVHQRIKA
jgi:hypothetical protein